MVSARSLVSVPWLASRLARGKALRVVDASWYMPSVPRVPATEFKDRRIPTAAFFDLDANSDTSHQMPHMLPSPEAFAACVASMGIGNDDHVVAYDASAEGIFSAARFWWMMKYFGHKQVSVLDGGLNKWVAENQALEEGWPPPTPTATTDYTITTPDNTMLVEHEVMKAKVTGASAAPVFQVLDARGAARFHGTAPEPRPGLRGGHMPHSISLPFTDVLDPETKVLRDGDALDKLLAGAGVEAGSPIVTTCGSGVTACVLALAIENSSLAGQQQTAVYDGSWTQWASDPDTPCVKTDKQSS